MRKGRDGGKKTGKKKREKTDENSGHYIIASSRPPERRPPERRTLVPKCFLFRNSTRDTRVSIEWTVAEELLIATFFLKNPAWFYVKWQPYSLVILKSLTRIQDVSKCIGLIVLQLSLENKFYFCCFQIKKFHVMHLKAQNLPPIRMPNIKISWDVGQQKRLYCLS